MAEGVSAGFDGTSSLLIHERSSFGIVVYTINTGKTGWIYTKYINVDTPPNNNAIANLLDAFLPINITSVFLVFISSTMTNENNQKKLVISRFCSVFDL